MSNLDKDRDPPRTGSTMPSRLRRITSLPGWPQQQQRSSPRESAEPQDGGNNSLEKTISRIPSKSNLRRIASTSSRIFRPNNIIDSTPKKETISEDSLKGTTKEMAQLTRRPSVVRLRHMASMPARSLKRMTSRPDVPPQDTSTTEGKYLSRMKSWSGSMMKTGTSRWFGTVRRPRPPHLPCLRAMLLDQKKLIS